VPHNDPCQSAQEIVQSFLVYDEQKRAEEKDSPTIKSAFLHIYECMRVDDASTPRCDELWYALWKDVAKQSKALRLVMRIARKESSLPIPITTGSFHTIEGDDGEYYDESDYPSSYPPSMN
jgi:hypothetical protein